MAVVEMRLDDGKTCLFLDFTDNRVFGIFPFVHIACHKDIRIPAVLLDQEDLVFCLVKDDGADCSGENGKAEVLACGAIRDHPFVVQMAKDELCPAMHAIVHLDHIGYSMTLPHSGQNFPVALAPHFGQMREELREIAIVLSLGEETL